MYNNSVHFEFILLFTILFFIYRLYEQKISRGSFIINTMLVLLFYFLLKVENDFTNFALPWIIFFCVMLVFDKISGERPLK